MYSLKSSTGCRLSAPNKAKSKVRDTTEMSCDNVDSDCHSTNRENSNTLDRQFIIGLTGHCQN